MIGRIISTGILFKSTSRSDGFGINPPRTRDRRIELRGRPNARIAVSLSGGGRIRPRK
jgi:hypothetical protein